MLTEVSRVKVVYMNKVPAAKRVKVENSETAVKLLSTLFPADEMEHKEFFGVLLLNRANMALSVSHISQGGSSSCIVDAKIIAQTALLVHATGVILAHNHPSGNRLPSASDRALTNKIKEGLKLLDLEVLDHVILTSHNDYYSFADEREL